MLFLKKNILKELKEKAEQYERLKFFEYMNEEEFYTVFRKVEDYLIVYEDIESIKNIMNILLESQKFFNNSSFIYNTLICILNTNIPDEDKLKSIKSFVTRLEDIMATSNEYRTRFLENQKIDNIEMDNKTCQN